MLWPRHLVCRGTKCNICQRILPSNQGAQRCHLFKQPCSHNNNIGIIKQKYGCQPHTSVTTCSQTSFMCTPSWVSIFFLGLMFFFLCVSLLRSTSLSSTRGGSAAPSSWVSSTTTAWWNRPSFSAPSIPSSPSGSTRMEAPAHWTHLSTYSVSA